ncbi:D-alanyl-D-alanine carboxypeptidase/D-alanyl-D-alanine endopeptidase [Pseudoneobacillus sp. C159]
MAIMMMMALLGSVVYFQESAVATPKQQLNQLFHQDPNLNGSIVGMSVRSASTGEIVFQHQANLRLRPASNLKLFTAAAALSVLGENYTFKTEVLTDGAIVGNMLIGNLFLKGYGDPTLLKADFEKFANQLTQKGITEIHGNVVGDDSWYDSVRHSIDLPWSDEQAYYGAGISALTVSPDEDFDGGTVRVEITPGKKVGHRANIQLAPKTNFITVINQTKTVDEKASSKMTMDRLHGKNVIHYWGTIPKGNKLIKEWVSVWNPTMYAATLFQESLWEKGITVHGRVIQGNTPKSATVLITHHSMPLSKILVPFMKLSNNTHAEMLIKEIGKVVKGEGSWDMGLEVLNEELREMGVHTENLLLRDGSGISHINLIPANELSRLLYNIQKNHWFPVFFNSLPVSGQKEKLVGGSLRYRMNQPDLAGKIRAKTGTLTSVSSLSGYIESKNSGTLIFTIILNNLLDEEKGKRLEDKMAEILINF